MHPLLEAISQGMSRGLPPMMAIEGGGGKKKTEPTPEELKSFGNWTGQDDVHVMAQDLSKRGLLGADQLLLDSANQSDPNSIINSQSDWKPSAIEKIVSNARRYNLRTPEEIMANKAVLMNTLEPRIQEAINDPYFAQIHPNFWQILSHSIIPQQWAKYDAQQLAAKKGMGAGTSVVKK